MVITCPPTFHIWKFMMKNMTPPNSGLTGRPVMQYSYAMYSLCRENDPARKIAKSCKKNGHFNSCKKLPLSSKSL